MRRRAVVAFAVVMCVLVATAPVAASHQLATASIHTSDTDFNGGTLTNTTVNGSGTSATVELLSGNETVDGFEDGDINEYGGDTGNATVQSTTVADGTNAVELDGTGSDNNIGIHDNDTFTNTPSAGDDFTAKARLDSTSTPSGATVTFAAQQEQAVPDDRYLLVLQNEANEFRFVKQVGGSQTTIASTSVQWATDVWYTVDVEWGANGDFTITVSNTTDSNVATLTATDTEFSSGGIGWQIFGPSSGIGYFDSFNLTVPQTPAEYISANHTAEDSEQGFVNLTNVTNATVTVTWETNDGSGWSTLNETTGITTAANHTFTWAVESNDTVRVNVTVFNASGNGEPAFVMADESVQFTAAEPTVNNSSASPTGTLTTAEPTFTIDVNDSDFPLAQGDTVTAELFVDGNSKGTDTLTANGTASVTTTVSGGDHNYSWTVTDEYGHSQDSETFNISAPGNITIRNETSPHGTVSGCTATVRIFEDIEENPTIVERTDSDGDGNISLSGLPIDGEFTVSMKCDGYHNRTAIIEDIFEQKSAFMLSEDRPSVENRFTVEDRTGDFPAGETEIIIQKAINRSEYGGSPSGFSWTNVAGDDLGASEEFVVDLEDGDRYRIKVQNDDGDQRILGAHNADLTATFNLVIGSIILDPVGTDQPAYEAVRTNESGQPVRVTFEYNDSRENTTEIWLHIYEYNNASNVLLENTSFTPSSGNFGTFTHTEDVPAAENGTTWVVDFLAERDGEDNVDAQVIVGPQRDVLPNLPGWLVSIIFVGTILIVAGLFSQLNADVGALAVAGVGAVMFFAGVVPDSVGSGVMLLALMVAGVMFINGRRGGEL